MIIFLSFLTTFNVSNNFFGAARSLPEISLTLKPNQHSQVKLVQIPDTLCIKQNRMENLNQQVWFGKSSLNNESTKNKNQLLDGVNAKDF